MSDMIERIARVIVEELGARSFDDLPPVASYIHRKTHGDWAIIDQSEAKDVARAALAELLSPSTAMLIAGVKAMRNPDLDVTEKELVLGWIAMISKAMER